MSSSLKRLKFLKVFTCEDSSTELLIPTPFATLHKQVLNEKFNLQTEYNHYSWDVKIEERNGKHYIIDGWPKFVKDNQLSTNYLLFELIKKSTFKVSIFNFFTGCKEELPSSHANAREELPFSHPNAREMNAGGPRLRLKLSSYHKRFANISKVFADKAGLVAQRTGMTLVDPSGKQWPVDVIRQNNTRRIQACRGWKEFISAQKLLVGSEISIELVAGSRYIFLVKVLKKAKHGELLTSGYRSNGNEAAREELPSSHPNAREMNAGGPQLRLKLSSYHKRFAAISKVFADKAGLVAQKTGVILVDPSGKQWPVVVTRQNNPQRFQVRRGWKEFISAQKLLVGSEISIELMAGSRYIFLVKVLKKAEHGELLTSSYRSNCNEAAREELPSSHPNAREMNAGGPRLHLKLHSFHKYYVNIPNDFAAKAGFVAQRTGMTLVDPSGKQWRVGVIERHNPRRIQTWKGWNDFISAQELIVGSEISIELMAGSTDVFQVKVLKKMKRGELLKSVNKSMGRWSVICLD